MGYWTSNIEEIPEGQKDAGRFFIQMYEYDFSDGGLTDIDEPSITAGTTYPTFEATQKVADDFGIRISNRMDA